MGTPGRQHQQRSNVTAKPGAGSRAHHCQGTADSQWFTPDLDVACYPDGILSLLLFLYPVPLYGTPGTPCASGFHNESRWTRPSPPTPRRPGAGPHSPAVGGSGLMAWQLSVTWGAGCHPHRDAGGQLPWQR